MNPVSTPDRPLLSRQEVASFLGISISTFSRWRREIESFPRPVEIGRTGAVKPHPRWRREDIEHWVSSCCASSTGAAG